MIKGSIDEARKWCDRLSLVRGITGEFVCEHRTGDTCVLPGKFLCDLVRLREKRKWEGRKIWSVSQLDTFVKCQMAYKLKYIDHVVPPDEKIALMLGKAFGVMRARLDAGKEDWHGQATDHGISVADHLKLAVTVSAVYDLPGIPKNAANEVPGSIELDNGDILQGYADGLNSAHTELYEWKYTFYPETYNLFSMQRQIGAYLALFRKVQRVWILPVKKLRQSQKVKELDSEWMERLDGLTKKGELLTPQVYEAHNFSWQRTLKELIHIADGVRAAIANNVWVPNYYACRTCDLTNACRKESELKAMEAVLSNTNKGEQP